MGHETSGREFVEKLAEQFPPSGLAGWAEIILDPRGTILLPSGLELVTGPIDARGDREMGVSFGGPAVFAHERPSRDHLFRMRSSFRSTVRVTQPSFSAICSLL